jgi:uncharacterized protein (DUF427 family)
MYATTSAAYVEQNYPTTNSILDATSAVTAINFYVKVAALTQPVPLVEGKIIVNFYISFFLFQ